MEKLIYKQRKECLSLMIDYPVQLNSVDYCGCRFKMNGHLYFRKYESSCYYLLVVKLVVN